MIAGVQEGSKLDEVPFSSDLAQEAESSTSPHEEKDGSSEKQENADELSQSPSSPLVEEQIRWFASRIAFPGQFMHQDWWKKLGLASFEHPYKTSQSLSFKAAIDQSIWKLYGLPDWRNFRHFSKGEKQLLSWRHRLEMLVLASALELTGRIEYLLRRTYRTYLMEYFASRQLQQLSIIWHGRDQLYPTCPPEKIIPELRALGEIGLLHATPYRLLWSIMRLERPVAFVEIAKPLLNLGKTMKWKRFVQLGRCLR